MSREKINCEVFQVRTGHDNLTVDRGLRIVDSDRGRFIDPQDEHNHTPSIGPAESKNLSLRLSDANPPLVNERAKTVEQISLRRTILEPGFNHSNLRVFKPVAEPLGRYALVSVVDHDPRVFPYPIKTHGASSAGTKLISLFGVVGDMRDPTVPDSCVGLSILEEGDSLFILSDLGEQGMIGRREIKVTYDPESEQGLRLKTMPSQINA